MRFVVDAEIPFAAALLAPHGEVSTLPGREIDRAALAAADALWVRTTVRVDAALLAGTPVRFVGTVTSGTDHLDTAWLDAQGIAWAAAPGANAGAVALWWAAAVATVARREGRPLAGRRVGVVGVGHVGRRVEAFARALGCEVLRCDPPRARAEGTRDFLPLTELLPRAELLTLHVPLARGGADPTWHLVGAPALAALAPGTLLVNSARGAVVDSAALLAAGDRIIPVLDVFEGEPEVAPAVVAAAALATPHLAGHSLDGKAAAVRRIYEATCAACGLASAGARAADLGPPAPSRLEIATAGLGDEEVLLAALTPFYDVEADDAALRRIVALPPGERGREFERHRTAATAHREPRGVELHLDPPRPRVAAALATLGLRPATGTAAVQRE